MDPPTPTRIRLYSGPGEAIQTDRQVFYTTDCEITSTLINSLKQITVLENKWRRLTSPMSDTDYKGVSYRFSEQLYHRQPALAGTSRGRRKL